MIKATKDDIATEACSIVFRNRPIEVGEFAELEKIGYKGIFNGRSQKNAEQLERDLDTIALSEDIDNKNARLMRLYAWLRARAERGLNYEDV